MIDRLRHTPNGAIMRVPHDMNRELAAKGALAN